MSCGCPKAEFNPEEGDLDLGLSPVYRMGFPCFFSMPMAYDLYAARLREDIQALGMPQRWPGVLLAHTGFFRGHILACAAAQQDLPGSWRIQALSAGFLVHTRLHHGGIGTVHKTIKSLQEDLLNQGRMPKELYLAHLSCPVCEAEGVEPRIWVWRRWTSSRLLDNRRAPRA